MANSWIDCANSGRSAVRNGGCRNTCNLHAHCISGKCANCFRDDPFRFHCRFMRQIGHSPGHLALSLLPFPSISPFVKWWHSLFFFVSCISCFNYRITNSISDCYLNANGIQIEECAVCTQTNKQFSSSPLVWYEFLFVFVGRENCSIIYEKFLIRQATRQAVIPWSQEMHTARTRQHHTQCNTIVSTVI